MARAAAAGARAVPGGFEVSAGGQDHPARRLILATGVVDDVPSIPGIRERWGKTVFHCPYCDGYELDRGRLGVLATGSLALHYATIVAQWGMAGETVLFLNDGDAPPPAELAELASRGIHVESQSILEARDSTGGIELLVLGSRRYELAALFAVPHTHLPGGFATELGCEVETGPRGTMYKTDPLTKETTVQGVYACGDIALAQHSVTFAMADGARAGIFAHQSLVFRDDAHTPNAQAPAAPMGLVDAGARAHSALAPAVTAFANSPRGTV